MIAALIRRLTTPARHAHDYAPALEATLDRLNTRAAVACRRSLLGSFTRWHHRVNGAAPITRGAVLAYKADMQQRGLAPATVNNGLTAVRSFISECVRFGLIDVHEAAAIQQLRGVPSRGVRDGNWLEAVDAMRLLAEGPDGSRTPQRDLAVLSLLLGCGLRRSEAAALRVEQMQRRYERWALVDIRLKGRVRTVPMPAWTHHALASWLAHSGRFAGSMLGVSPAVIAYIVHRAGRQIERPDLAPHDLRRTFARLARRGGAGLEQLQRALGHESIEVTMRYVGRCDDFADAACDRLGIER